jgi:hypothetical protein
MGNKDDEHVTHSWTDQYRMMDKHRNFGMIFNSRDDYSIMWVFLVNHVEEATDKRKTWQPRKITSVEEMSNPFST